MHHCGDHCRWIRSLASERSARASCVLMQRTPAAPGSFECSPPPTAMRRSPSECFQVTRHVSALSHEHHTLLLGSSWSGTSIPNACGVVQTTPSAETMEAIMMMPPWAEAVVLGVGAYTTMRDGARGDASPWEEEARQRVGGRNRFNWRRRCVRLQRLTSLRACCAAPGQEDDGRTSDGDLGSFASSCAWCLVENALSCESLCTQCCCGVPLPRVFMV